MKKKYLSKIFGETLININKYFIFATVYIFAKKSTKETVCIFTKN